MAKYRLTGPDGSTYEITAPDSASQDEVFKTFHASVGKQSKAQSDTAAWEKKIKGDLTGDMGGFGKFVAGYGSAVPRLARGIGQRLGINSQAEVDEANKLDQPLMETGAGMAGNIAGNVGAAVPTAFVPGANTIAGAAAIGGVLGAAQPTTTGESALKNGLIGGAAGPAGLIAGRAIGSAWQGGKALLEPFSQSGRDKIGGRVIQRFADDPSRISRATNTPTVTGARPTLAEQTGDAGLARLQDSLRSADPQIGNQIGARLSENNASRVNALRALAGEDGARDMAVAHRASTGAQQYERAFSVPVKAEELPPALRGEVTKLMQMPAVRDAMGEARTNAANFGMKGTDDNVVAGLHQAKLAMDDQISKLTGGGAVEANKAAGIRAARDRLVTFMEKVSPDYQEARVTYAQMSKPINSMDVAGHLAKKGLSNGSDLSGTPTINRNALLGAMKDENALVKQATGRTGLGGLDNVMEPADLAMLRSIAGEVDRAGAVATAGNGPGSATAQRMASNNILHQLVGPTGLPKSWADSVLANTIVGKPLNLLYGGVAEPKIQQALAEAVLNPAKARQMLAAATPAQRPALLQLLQRTAAARTAPAANGLANRP
jgi:hypothetical protein